MSKNTYDVLAEVVSTVRCKPGWSFDLRDTDEGLRLVITVDCFDSARTDRRVPFRVAHLFAVPPTTYNERSWQRWVFDCCRGVENHELGEWFRRGSDRPFSPLHGPGENPYVVHEFRPVEDALTTQDGSIREPYE